MRALNQTEFRAVVGHFASGVTVITSSGQDGPAGMTASAFTSLSLEPMLVAACFDRTARTLGAVQTSGRAGINILARDQSALSDVFASKLPESQKFDGIGWSEHAGVPILDGVIAWFAGTVRDLVDGGDHLIGIIEVDEMAASGGDPLIYFRGGYSELGEGHVGD